MLGIDVLEIYERSWATAILCQKRHQLEEYVRDESECIDSSVLLCGKLGGSISHQPLDSRVPPLGDRALFPEGGRQSDNLA
jgi:hypothetical protein